MNNSTEAQGFETAELPEYIAWTSLVLCSIILFVGILGNLLVIIVILTSKVLRSSTNLFLLNLSIADLLVLAICTSSSLVEIVTRSDKWILGKVHILMPRTSVFFCHTVVWSYDRATKIINTFNQSKLDLLDYNAENDRKSVQWKKKMYILGFLKVEIRFRITRFTKEIFTRF